MSASSSKESVITRDVIKASHLSCIAAIPCADKSKTLLAVGEAGYVKGPTAVKVVDAQADALVATFDGHMDGVSALLALGDGRTLVSASYDGTVRLWDIAALTGAPAPAPAPQADGADAAAASPVPAGAEDEAKGASAGPVRALTGSSAPVLCLAPLKGGAGWVAGGCADGTVDVWDPATGEKVAALRAGSLAVRAVAALSDGGLATGADDSYVCVWRPRSTAAASSPAAHTRSVSDSSSPSALSRAASAASSSGGSQGAGPSSPLAAALAAAAAASPFAPAPSLAFMAGGRVHAVAQLPGGAIAVGLQGAGGVELWDAPAGAAGAKLARTLKGPQFGVRSLTVVPSGALASGSDDYVIRLWDCASGRCAREIDVDGIINGVNFRPSNFTNAPAAMYVQCGVALKLWDMAELGKARGITDYVHYGTYNCRTISGTQTLSQHAYANAIDIAGVQTAGGQRYTVLQHWEDGVANPTTPGGQLLHWLAHTMYDEQTWNIILTPEYNAAHDDHFHVDLTPGSWFLSE